MQLPARLNPGAGVPGPQSPDAGPLDPCERPGVEPSWGCRLWHYPAGQPWESQITPLVTVRCSCGPSTVFVGSANAAEPISQVGKLSLSHSHRS